MRLVFTLTTGRSGSRTLAGLLGANLRGAHVHHERLGARVRGVHTPSIPVLQAFNHFGFTAEVQRFWTRKWEAIVSEPTHTWVETSHVLLKAGLVEALPMLDPQHDVHLVHLRRERRAVLHSFMRRGDFQRRGNRLQWYLEEAAPRNLVPLPEPLADTSHGLALWYILETEARIALACHKVQDLPGVRIHQLDTPALGDPDRAGALLDDIGLVPRPDPVIIPPRMNEGRGEPLEPAFIEQLDELLTAVEDFDADLHIAAVLESRPDPFEPVRVRIAHTSPAPETPQRFIGSPDPHGSALASELLGCHPGLAAISDTSYLPEILTELARKATPQRTAEAILQHSAAWAPRLHAPQASRTAPTPDGPGPRQLRVSLGGFIEASSELAAAISRREPLTGALLRYLDHTSGVHAAAEGRQDWLNQTPTNLRVAPLLVTLLPTARLLLIVRDPRDAALSVVSTAGGPDSLADAPDWWRRTLHPGLAARELAPDRVRFLRYEDLVCNPERTLQVAQAFLGLQDATDDILARARDRPLREGRAQVGHWRTHMSSGDAELMSTRLADALDLFGYPPG